MSANEYTGIIKTIIMRNDCVELYIHLLYRQNCNGTIMLKVYLCILNEVALISPCGEFHGNQCVLCFHV